MGKDTAPHSPSAITAKRAGQWANPATLSSNEENPPVDTAARTWVTAAKPSPTSHHTSAMPITVNTA